mgnify:CR=1 FL=1
MADIQQATEPTDQIDPESSTENNQIHAVDDAPSNKTSPANLKSRRQSFDLSRRQSLDQLSRRQSFDHYHCHLIR